MEAVSIASEMMRSLSPGVLTPKGDRDMVSEVDLAIERRLREHLHGKTPEIGFLGEEDGPVGNGEFVWALDPVDGTVNFVRGVPLCAVSLALLHRGRPVLGVIHLPFLGTRYHASDGGGAFAGDRRVRVGLGRPIEEAIVPAFRSWNSRVYLGVGGVGEAEPGVPQLEAREGTRRGRIELESRPLLGMRSS